MIKKRIKHKIFQLYNVSEELRKTVKILNLTNSYIILKDLVHIEELLNLLPLCEVLVLRASTVKYPSEDNIKQLKKIISKLKFIDINYCCLASPYSELYENLTYDECMKCIIINLEKLPTEIVDQTEINITEENLEGIFRQFYILGIDIDKIIPIVNSHITYYRSYPKIGKTLGEFGYTY